MRTQQRTDYLAAGGTKCPYCKSDQNEGGDADYNGDTISKEVSCLACNMSWHDIYTLADVLPDAHNENEPQDEPEGGGL